MPRALAEIHHALTAGAEQLNEAVMLRPSEFLLGDDLFVAIGDFLLARFRGRLPVGRRGERRDLVCRVHSEFLPGGDA